MIKMKIQNTLQGKVVQNKANSKFKDDWNIYKTGWRHREIQDSSADIVIHSLSKHVALEELHKIEGQGCNQVIVWIFWELIISLLEQNPRKPMNAPSTSATSRMGIKQEIPKEKDIMEPWSPTGLYWVWKKGPSQVQRHTPVTPGRIGGYPSPGWLAQGPPELPNKACFQRSTKVDISLQEHSVLPKGPVTLSDSRLKADNVFLNSN